jgi:hypothetical protein
MIVIVFFIQKNMVGIQFMIEKLHGSVKKHIFLQNKLHATIIMDVPNFL